MQVKLLTSRCGHVPQKQPGAIVTFAQAVGEVIEVDAAEGRRMIDAGQASLVKDSDAGSREKRG